MHARTELIHIIGSTSISINKSSIILLKIVILFIFNSMFQIPKCKLVLDGKG